MSAFVEGIELRVMDNFVVFKTTRRIPYRVVRALLRAVPVVLSVRLASARRLEVQTADWAYAEGVVMPIVVNGSMLARCPGDVGYDVRVVHMQRTYKGCWVYTDNVEVYPQFANGVMWATIQQQLFGNDWMLSWLD